MIIVLVVRASQLKLGWKGSIKGDDRNSLPQIAQGESFFLDIPIDLMESASNTLQGHSIRLQGQRETSGHGGQ